MGSTSNPSVTVGIEHPSTATGEPGPSVSQGIGPQTGAADGKKKLLLYSVVGGQDASLALLVVIYIRGLPCPGLPAT